VAGGCKKLNIDKLYTLYCVLLLTKYYQDVKIKDDGMGEACSKHEGDGKYAQSLKRRDHLRTLP
jgi:hypothetical protein